MINKSENAALDARWPQFSDALHGQFREFVNKFNDGHVNQRLMVSPPAIDSITATSGVLSVTIASDLESRVLKMTYKTLRPLKPQTSDLLFYVRLGKDGQIEIHDLPDAHRLVTLNSFLVQVLTPFFLEIAQT